ncbi:MAG: gliding motility-associated C-terminal domain-containing protein [Bacteroidales bacterium]|nr:gliding motility-associated C-terminal domain-containing protein [Bacteroidales bacterium]
MKKAKNNIVLLLLLVVATSACGQTAVGRDFWVTCYGSHSGDVYHDHVPSLVIVAYEASSVSIANPLTGWETSVTLAAGGSASVEVPYVQVLCTQHNQIVSRALHVTTTGDISLWYVQRMTGSNDMTMILPTQSLGRQYIMQDYPGFRNTPGLAVAAVEDSTVLTFTFPPGENVPGLASNPHTVTLDAGQAYFLTEDNNGGSFCGSLVEGNHPFFLMQGNMLAMVPASGMPGDCIFEQALPIDYWGRHFVLVPTVRESDGDRVRVTSSADGCVLRVDGQQVAVIDCRETYELYLPRDTAHRLDASQPVMAMLYLSSTDYGGEGGDPSVVMVVPVEQGVSKVTFREPIASLPAADSYVNIAARTADVSHITFDGTPIDTFFHPVDSLFSYARVPISNAVHHIVNPVGTLTSHFYWLGWRASEAAICDIAFRHLDRVQLLTDGEERSHYAICQGTTVHFLVTGVMSAQWMMDSVPLMTTSPEMDYRFDSVGSFLVEAVLHDDFDTSLHDTLQVTISVYPTAATSEEDSVCFNATYHWHGRTLEEGGTYVDSLVTVWGCDSVVTLTLHQIEKPDVALTVDIDCAHLSYSLTLSGAPSTFVWNSVPPDISLAGHENDSTIYPYPDITTCYTVNIDYQCPFSESAILQPISLPHARVRTLPEYLTLDNQELMVCDITEGSTNRTWLINGIPMGDGESCLSVSEIDVRNDSVAVTLIVFNGTCYDTITIGVPILHINLWAPNVFTPTIESNQEFEIITTGVAEGELEIYDRQGRLIVHADDYRLGWDGTRNGIPLPQGTYVWRLHYHTTWFPEQWHTRVGTVTLLR